MNKSYRRCLSNLLWVAIIIGLAVSVFTVYEELCLATACSDAASFTIFGVGMGMFGIAYFIIILILIWLRTRILFLDWVLFAMVFAGVGAEFRLLWIQKFVIGSWCPLCVTICSALFVAAVLLVIEKYCGHESKPLLVKKNKWIILAVTMITAGLLIAYSGVKALF